MSPHTDDQDRFIREALREHEVPLLRYATRLLGDSERARDVVQDTFTKLCRQTPSAIDGHLAPWLFTVCRRGALDLLRKEGRVSRFGEGQEENLVASDPAPAIHAERAESWQRVLSLLEQLPPNQQEVVRLKFQEGFSYKEISAITHLSVTNVGFLLHTAISTLRREMSRASAA